MIEGCDTCANYANCESDPAVCENYECDEEAYVAANLAELMRSVSPKFKTVRVERLEGYKVIVTLDNPIPEAEEDAAVTLMSAKVEQANVEEGLIENGSIQVAFEVDVKIPDGWPPDEVQ